MSVPSLGGFWYYILFIDDFFRKTWTYFLKCKKQKEILKGFREFKTLTGNLSRHKIKTLRTDNRGEYTSDLLKSFVKKHELRASIPFLITHNKTG